MNVQEKTDIPWPSADAITYLEVYVDREKYRINMTPEGSYIGVTSVVSMLPKKALIGWAARVEKDACLAAAADAYQDLPPFSPRSMFLLAVESRLGTTREHQKILEKAGDLGSAVHKEIKRRTLDEMNGQEALPLGLDPDVKRSADSWFVLRNQWGLKPVRVEQPVWDPKRRSAGTIDQILEGPGGLVLVDFKTSKGLYIDHHVQVAEYLRLARRYHEISAAMLVKLPKKKGDTIEVQELGETVPVRTHEQLWRIYDDCHSLFRLIVEPRIHQRNGQP